jgi:hypothetical protein
MAHDDHLRRALEAFRHVPRDPSESGVWRNEEFVRSPLGLWVPAAFAAGAGSLAPSTSFTAQLVGTVRPREYETPWDFVYQTVGYQDLAGVRRPWDDIAVLLAPYSLEQVTETVSRMTLVLSHADSPEEHGATQDRIGEAMGLNMTALRKAAAKGPNADRVPPDRLSVFHERQMLALLKYAFLTIPLDRAGTDNSLVGLATALLVVNDYLDAGIEGREPADPETQRRFRLYTFANALFNRGVTMLSEFTRGYLLFIEDQPRLRGTRFYVDLPTRLERATGVHAERLWQVLFALFATYRSVKPDRVDTTDRWIDAAGHFGACPGVSDDDASRCFGLVTRTPKQFRDAITAAYGGDALQSFDAVVFARTPLVRDGNRVSCLSMPLLQEALGAGLQHRYLDESVFSADERKQFLDYRGDLLEDYVDQMLRRMYPSSDRYVDPRSMAHLTRTRGDKSCDAAVIYGDAVILLEVKGRIVPLGARSGSDLVAFENMLRTSYADAVAQIRTTVGRIEAGTYEDVGLDPARIRRYYPTVVTFDLALDALTYQSLAESFASDPQRSHAKMAPFQPLEVGELEQLEVGVAEGIDLRRLLDQKLADAATRALSFRNFFYVRNDPWARRQNPYLAREYERIMARLRRDLFGGGVA